jgi:hypothetical protein
MFLNGVFLGVWAAEEVVPAMRVVEEPDGCVGDRGCGGVTIEGRAGATNIGVMLISGAGDGGDETPESCKSQISGNLELLRVPTTSSAVRSMTSGFRFQLPFQDVTKRRKVIVIIS